MEETNSISNMKYEKYISRLMDIFHLTLASHWLNHGEDKIGLHKTLDDLYKELVLFADELVETNFSVNRNDQEVTLEFLKVHTGSGSESLAILLTALRELRKDLSDDKLESEYDDWKSRLISSLNHYIFMLDAPDKSMKIFSYKNEDPIVAEIRKLFKNQNEFVTRFNNYLKGKKDPDPKVQEFFKKKESYLIQVSDAILATNMKLFDLRQEIDFEDNQDDKLKFNELVQFFDLFQ